ncbi:MAG TPA: hypothetical protein VK461_06165 [Acidimicrobiales bacterium]|nr:hypothetical protein [Acidimicrobiales bacterium]
MAGSRLEDISHTVICQYRPRAGLVDDFMDLVREHRSVLVELELVTSTPEIVYIGGDQDGAGPLIVTIFQWAEAEGSRRAAQHPRVGAIWERMETLVEDRAMGPGMAFPHFSTRQTL